MGFECSMPARPLPKAQALLLICLAMAALELQLVGAHFCGQRARIHGFVTCHPPTLQVVTVMVDLYVPLHVQQVS